MSLQRFNYFARRMLQIVRMNPSGTSVAFIMLTMFLLSLGIFYTGYRTGQHLLPAWAAHNKAVMYLKPQTSGQDLDSLTRELGKWPEVVQAKAVTLDEGRKRLQKELGDLKDILGSIPETVFPPAVEIVLSDKPRSQDETEALLAKMRQYPQVEDVFYGKSWAEKLEFFLKPVRLLGFGAAGILGFLSLLTMYHSAIFILHARREEIEICSILGATPFFTKVPLYMESVFSGIISGIIASICLAFVVSWLKRSLPIPIAVALPLHGVEAFLLSAGIAGCGVVVSFSARWLAFKRTLKTVSPLTDSTGEYVQNP